MRQTVAELVAHQGGWDEILLVAVPLAAFAAVLFLANRRANVKLAQRAEALPKTHPPTERGRSGSE